MKYQCTQCDKLYHVKEEMVGKQFKCRKCSTVNTISVPKMEAKKHDTVASYNQLLQELLVYEKQAPTIYPNS